MADGVDPAMNAMQAPGADPVPDCIVGEPGAVQLHGGDEPVLAGGYLRNDLIRRDVESGHRQVQAVSAAPRPR